MKGSNTHDEAIALAVLTHMLSKSETRGTVLRELTILAKQEGIPDITIQALIQKAGGNRPQPARESRDWSRRGRSGTSFPKR